MRIHVTCTHVMSFARPACVSTLVLRGDGRQGGGGLVEVWGG